MDLATIAAETAQEIRAFTGTLHMWSNERIAEPIQQALTTATAEAQGEIEATRIELQRVGGMPVKTLVNEYLRLLHELNERDKPDGFESWEDYHKHVIGMKARITDLERQLAEARTSFEGLIVACENADETGYVTDAGFISDETLKACREVLTSSSDIADKWVRVELLELRKQSEEAAWANRDQFCASVNRIAKMVGMNVENAAPESVERHVEQLRADLAAARKALHWFSKWPEWVPNPDRSEEVQKDLKAAIQRESETPNGQNTATVE